MKLYTILRLEHRASIGHPINISLTHEDRAGMLAVYPTRELAEKYARGAEILELEL